MKITLELDSRTVLRWGLGVVLAGAALGKIANPMEFYGALVAYRLPLPSEFIRAAAIVLPWLELLCGVLLIAGRAWRAAAVWSLVLFAIFALTTGQAWARGLEISCGCFKFGFLGEGSLAKFLSSTPFAFFRALIFLGCAVHILRPPVVNSSKSLS